MLVFIDESGDPGFRLNAGSSPIFVTAMVIFDDAVAAQTTQEAIRKCQRQLGIKPEFKFSKCKNDFRTEFFNAVSDCNFRVRSVVVQKDQIHSSNLRSNKESFYNYFISQMVSNDAGALQHAKVVIDGSGDRNFKQQFLRYLRSRVPPEQIRKVSLKDSKNDHLIQLADMCAGAIARSYRKEKADCEQWRNQLRRSGQLNDVWEFR